MDIVDYIELALRDRNGDANYVQVAGRAKQAYDFGNDYGDNAFNLEQLFEDERFRRLPESTPTRQIVSDSVPPLCMWAMDNRSVRMIDAVRHYPDGGMENLSTKEALLIEEQIRKMIMKHWYDNAFNQLLITGVLGVSAGLEDVFMVVDSEDLRFDGDQDRWMLFDRDIMGETMNMVSSSWTSMDGMRPMVHDERAEVRVTHGQVHIPHMNAYVEFVQSGSERYFQVHRHPVMFKQVFTCDEEGEPLGVHELIRNEELTIIKQQQAINSRVNEAIQASAFVDGSMLADPEADINELYSRTLISVQGRQIQNDTPAPIAEFVPSRVAEIEVYAANIERLMQKCYQMTGLHPRPVMISGSNTTATEAIQTYRNSTLRMRQIIGEFSETMGGVIRAVAARDFGIQASYDVIRNPLDFEERKVVIAEMLPDMIKMQKEDPTGKITGGIVNARTIQKMYAELFEASGLPAEYLAEPGPNQLENADTMRQAQQEEGDAAQMIAQAEKMKAQAELLRARVAAAELSLKNRSHNDEIMVDMLELVDSARERFDFEFAAEVSEAMGTIGRNTDGEETLSGGGGGGKKPPMMPQQGGM